MKSKFIFWIALIGVFLISCNEELQPTATATLPPPTSTPIPTSSPTPKPTSTPTAKNNNGLPDSVEVIGAKVLFNEWGLSVELPSNTWAFNPQMYNKTSFSEGFVFNRSLLLFDDTGIYSPSVGIFFFNISEGLQPLEFSSILQSQMGSNFPAIESTFGAEGTEPELKIPAVGYFGYLEYDTKYAAYVVHGTQGKVGVAFSYQVPDSLLGTVKDEIYEIIQSLEFLEN